MLHKWDSKLLLLSGIKHEGLKKVVKYYFYQKDNKIKNNARKVLSDKRSYFSGQNINLSNKTTFNKVDKRCLKNHKEKLLKLADKTLAHEFNLLGSGWVNLNVTENNYKGYEGVNYSSQVPMNINIASSNEYTPLKWNVDFVSGFHWPFDVYFKDIKFGGTYGADIKKPWEFGRFYHLAQLSFAFNLSAHQKYLKEIKNQFYDFKENCPVYIGPQWGNAMEVGIRAINWIFCIDQVGINNFDESFANNFENFLSDHLDYILSQLEWTTIARSNHYLANLCAIVVILSRLERSEELSALYYWAASELNHEIEFQFHEDGGSYEGSTGYHRLSSELVFIALNILGTEKPVKKSFYKKFKKENRFCLPHFHEEDFKFYKHKERIERMITFLKTVQFSPGHMIQVGDMDGGRVLKLTPLFTDSLEVENQLDMGPVLAFMEPSKHEYLESKIFKTYMRLGDRRTNTIIRNVNIDHLLNTQIRLHTNRKKYLWKSETNLLSSLKFSTFRNFGLYIVESENLFLSIRCGGAGGQNGVGGHNHNDQLSINLKMNNELLIADPGSYIYTADPELRNKYRSVKSHFAPTVGNKEPGLLSNNLFRLKQDYNAECLYFDGHTFLGFHDAYGEKIFRYIEINEYSVEVIDYYDGDLKIDSLPLKNGYFAMPVGYSPGYGEKS